MSGSFCQANVNISHGSGLPKSIAMRYVSFLVQHSKIEDAFHVTRHVMTDVNRAPSHITPVFIAMYGDPKGVPTYSDAHHYLVTHHRKNYPEAGTDLIAAFARLNFSAKRDNNLVMRSLYNASPEKMVSYPIGDYPVDNFLDTPATFPVEDLVASYIECIRTHNAEAIRLVALMLFLAVLPGLSTKTMNNLKFKEGRSKPDTLKYRANMTSRVEFRVQGVLEHNVRTFLMKERRIEEDKYARDIWKMDTPESAVLVAEYLCLPPDSIAPIHDVPMPKIASQPMCEEPGEFLCTLPELPREANKPGMDTYHDFYVWYFMKYSPLVDIPSKVLTKLTKNVNRMNENDEDMLMLSFSETMFRIYPLPGSPLSMTIKPSLFVTRLPEDKIPRIPACDCFTDVFTKELHSKNTVLFQAPRFFAVSPPLLSADACLDYLYRGPYSYYPGFIMARQKVFEVLGVSHLIVPSIIIRDQRQMYWIRTECLLRDKSGNFPLSGPSRGSENRQFVYPRHLPLQYFRAKTQAEALGVLTQDVITFLLVMHVMEAGVFDLTCNLILVDGKLVFTKYHFPPHKHYPGSGPDLLMKVFRENEVTHDMNSLYYAVAFRPEIVGRIEYALAFFREKMPQVLRCFEELDLMEQTMEFEERLAQIERSLK